MHRVTTVMTMATRTETALFSCQVTQSEARFSPCGTWRYTLHRVWDQDRGLLMVVGLNPSTADEMKNDPTVTRCINYARAWGFGGLVMMNAFAFRATDPRVMKAAPDPVGPDNDFWLSRMAREARLIVAAWGNHGLWLERQTKVLSLIDREVYCLGVTKAGAPRHPLYLRREAEPILFRQAQEDTGGKFLKKYQFFEKN